MPAEEAEEESKKLRAQKEALEDQVDQMKVELQGMNQLLDESDKYKDMYNFLRDKGVVDHDGRMDINFEKFMNEYTE